MAGRGGATDAASGPAGEEPGARSKALTQPVTPSETTWYQVVVPLIASGGPCISPVTSTREPQAMRRSGSPVWSLGVLHRGTPGWLESQPGTAPGLRTTATGGTEDDGTGGGAGAGDGAGAEGDRAASGVGDGGAAGSRGAGGAGATGTGAAGEAGAVTTGAAGPGPTR